MIDISKYITLILFPKCLLTRMYHYQILETRFLNSVTRKKTKTRYLNTIQTNLFYFCSLTNQIRSQQQKYALSMSSNLANTNVDCLK